MTGKNEEVIIKTTMAEIIARISLRDGKLHGHCEWYDLRGNLVSYGSFNNGMPVAGTFLNWANFLSQLGKEMPYDPSTYCRDWVTVFEVHFASELPNYRLVIEAYSNGMKI